MGLDQLILVGLVNISLDGLISVCIGYYKSRLVSISIDRLIVKKYLLILVRIS